MSCVPTSLSSTCVNIHYYYWYDCVCVTGPDTVGARLSVTPAVQSCRDFLGGWAFCPRFYACAV